MTDAIPRIENVQKRKFSQNPDSTGSKLPIYLQSETRKPVKIRFPNYGVH